MCVPTNADKFGAILFIRDSTNRSSCGGKGGSKGGENDKKKNNENTQPNIRAANIGFPEHIPWLWLRQVPRLLRTLSSIAANLLRIKACRLMSTQSHWLWSTYQR